MNTSPNPKALAHFNAEEYREALLLFEQQWHAERSGVLRAMIQLCNALNQLRLGLVSGPRHNLASAAQLLAPLPDRYAGIPIAAIREYIAKLRALLPDGVEQVAWGTVPRLQIDVFD